MNIICIRMTSTESRIKVRIKEIERVGSIMAAILLSLMEVSYCTSGFFVAKAKPAKQFC